MITALSRFPHRTAFKMPFPLPPFRTVMRRRTRLLISAAVMGMVTAAAARLEVRHAVLAGWNAGALLYLAWMWQIILTTDEPALRVHAADRDASPWVILFLAAGAVLFSLGAIAVALYDISAHPERGAQVAGLALAGFTLVVSWMLFNTVFAIHYAHLYFEDRDRDGTEYGGLAFPGERPTSYMDFVYFALSVGAAFQVSDVSVTTSRFRRVVTIHSVLAFLFNTCVLALAINLMSGLLGT